MNDNMDEPPKDATNEPMHEFASGARRSEIKPRYDLIPTQFLERLARRYDLGAKKYGEYNWQKGLPLSDTFNHIAAHLAKVAEEIRTVNTEATRYGPKTASCSMEDYNARVVRGLTDDDLAGAAWGIATLMWYFKEGKYASASGANSTEGRLEPNPASGNERQGDSQLLQRPSNAVRGLGGAAPASVSTGAGGPMRSFTYLLTEQEAKLVDQWREAGR